MASIYHRIQIEVAYEHTFISTETYSHSRALEIQQQILKRVGSEVSVEVVEMCSQQCEYGYLKS